MAAPASTNTNENNRKSHRNLTNKATAALNKLSGEYGSFDSIIKRLDDIEKKVEECCASMGSSAAAAQISSNREVALSIEAANAANAENAANYDGPKFGPKTQINSNHNMALEMAEERNPPPAAAPGPLTAAIANNANNWNAARNLAAAAHNGAAAAAPRPLTAAIANNANNWNAARNLAAAAHNGAAAAAPGPLTAAIANNANNWNAARNLAAAADNGAAAGPGPGPRTRKSRKSRKARKDRKARKSRKNSF